MTIKEAKRNLIHAIRWNDMPKKEALDVAIKVLEQIESLNRVRLGAKQYVRLDDVLKIVKEQEDGNSKADKKENRRI